MRSTIIAALLGFLVPVIGIMAVNAWHDPFRYYGPIEDSRYSINARWQNPGMIRNNEYDTAVIGTSRFANFKPSMFVSTGWNVLKVTAAGSMAYEQLDTLELVLNEGRAKRVVAEMSYISFTGLPQRNPFEFPEFLYKNSFETPFQYLLSFDLLRQSLRIPQRVEMPLDELYVWWELHKNEFSEQKMLQTAVESCQRKHPPQRKQAPTAEYLLRFAQLIADHPDVEFIGVFPPMAAIALGRHNPDGTLSETLRRRLDFRTGVAEIATGHPNFTLYDYASQSDIVLDYSRYKDPGHFDMAVTEQMAREISTGSAPLADLEDINGPLLQVQAQVDVAGLPCLSGASPNESLAAN